MVSTMGVNKKEKTKKLIGEKKIEDFGKGKRTLLRGLMI